MRAARVFLPLSLAVIAFRLCHWRVVWVEEAYPIAAALEMLEGRIPYRDFWFDKPPLSPVFYLFTGAATGWKLRLAGALTVVAACWFAYLLARRLWGETEGRIASCFLAFFLTFDIAAAVMAAAPDLLMVAPHLAAVYFCVRRQPLVAGFAAGIALLLNPKGLFVAAACIMWKWRAAHWLLAGIAAALFPMAAWLGLHSALQPFWEQVWQWGMVYANNPPFNDPVASGLQRTANWAGFHGVLVAAAAAVLWKERTADVRRLLLWSLIALAAVAAGWRFFPRYYFHLLAPAVILAARGLMLLRPRARVAVLALLLIPLVRFGPRYALVAAGQPWNDLALYEDAREAAQIVAQRGARSLLVWGYRPEIYAVSRVPTGTPFLDSQPLTGVIADRHLISSESSAPILAARNRNRLVAYEPHFIVDGLGPLNPALAITEFRDLDAWMRRYREVARTRFTIIYEMERRVRP